jgi:hypothetical protein
MSAKRAGRAGEVEIQPNKPIVEQLRQFEPEHCPNCAGQYQRKDVKELPAEHDDQIRWHCFCGWCGGIYTIEIEA